MLFVQLSQLAQLSTEQRDMIRRASKTSELVTDTFAEMWTDVLRGPLYASIATVGILLAVVMLGIFLVQWAGQALNGDTIPLAQMIWPILVVSLLANQGALLATVTLQVHDIVVDINRDVLQRTIRDGDLAEAYRQQRILDAANQTYTAAYQACSETRPDEPRALDRCRQRAVIARRAYLDAQEQIALANSESLDLGWAGSLLQSALTLIMMGVHAAYGWLIEIVMLLTALLGPIAVGLTLLPTQQKLLFAWIGGFFSTVLAKLTFNIISGLAAYASLKSGIGYVNALLLPFLLGLFAPILSTFIGIQGGNALTSAIATIATYKSFAIAMTTGRTGGRFIRRIF